MGFLEEERASEDRLADRVFWKTPRWAMCFTLDTDHYLVEPTKHRFSSINFHMNNDFPLQRRQSQSKPRGCFNEENYNGNIF